MVGFSIYENNEIDTNSLEFKEIVSNSLKNYIINNWNQCVSFKRIIENGTDVLQFYVEL